MSMCSFSTYTGNKIRRAFAQGVSDHEKIEKTNCQFRSEVEIEQERITTIEQIKSIA